MVDLSIIHNLEYKQCRNSAYLLHPISLRMTVALFLLQFLAMYNYVLKLFRQQHGSKNIGLHVSFQVPDKPAIP